VLVVCCRTESASLVESEHRAVADVDFIAKSSSVDMPDGAVRVPVTVTILPVSSTLMCTPRGLAMYSTTISLQSLQIPLDSQKDFIFSFLNLQMTSG